MDVPAGVQAKPGQACRLIKSLYDLKQSLRFWNERFNEELLKMGFTRSKHDYCLYINLNLNDELILILYVDDLLIAGRNLSSIEKLKQDLGKIFEMSDCGELRHFLGIKIAYDYDKH